MKKPNVAAISIAIFLIAMTSESALAGPYSDELAKCLVKSTTDANKNSLVKWIFAIAALHPEVKSIASVSDAQRNKLSRNTAKLFESLLTESCRQEAQQALKYEGQDTIGDSFQILGQVAARELFSNPNVAKGMAEFGNQFDKKRMEMIFGSVQ